MDSHIWFGLYLLCCSVYTLVVLLPTSKTDRSGWSNKKIYTHIILAGPVMWICVMIIYLIERSAIGDKK